MNNTFDINRFGLLLRRQIQEFGKIYLISLAILVGVIVISYIIGGPRYENPGQQDLKMYFRYGTFIILGFLFISVTASTYFASFGQKSRAIVELMLPCSKLEKFLAGVLFTAIVSTLSYFAIFFVIDQVMLVYIESQLVEKHDLISFYELAKLSDTFPFAVCIVLTLTLTVSSVFMLGSIYFERFHYLKTAVFLIITLIALGWSYYGTATILYEGKYRIHSPSTNQVDEYTIMYAICGVVFLITLCIWAIGYVRLKEKEV